MRSPSAESGLLGGPRPLGEVLRPFTQDVRRPRTREGWRRMAGSSSSGSEARLPPSREVPGPVTLVEWNVLIEIFREINKAFPRVLFAGKLEAWKPPEGGRQEKSHNEMKPRRGAGPGVGPGGGAPSPGLPRGRVPPGTGVQLPGSPPSAGQALRARPPGGGGRSPGFGTEPRSSVLAGAGGPRLTLSSSEEARSLPPPPSARTKHDPQGPVWLEGHGGSRCASVYLRHLGRQGLLVVWVTTASHTRSPGL